MGETSTLVFRSKVKEVLRSKAGETERARDTKSLAAELGLQCVGDRIVTQRF